MPLLLPLLLYFFTIKLIYTHTPSHTHITHTFPPRHPIYTHACVCARTHTHTHTHKHTFTHIWPTLPDAKCSTMDSSPKSLVAWELILENVHWSFFNRYFQISACFGWWTSDCWTEASFSLQLPLFWGCVNQLFLAIPPHWSRAVGKVRSINSVSTAKDRQHIGSWFGGPRHR